MPYSVVVDQFEGPLDLLLQLVEASQLEITAISAGAVTEQFLAHIKRLEHQDAAELSEFLQLATRLIYIKSLALLPTRQDEELAELRRFDHELAEYRRFQAASRTLATLSHRPAQSVRRAPSALPKANFRPPSTDLAALAQLFQQAIATAPVTAVHDWDEEITLEEMQARLRRSPPEVSLSELIAECRDRGELVILFLALLELVRLGEVVASQEGSFGPMMVRRG